MTIERRNARLSRAMPCFVSVNDQLKAKIVRNRATAEKDNTTMHLLGYHFT